MKVTGILVALLLGLVCPYMAHGAENESDPARVHDIEALLMSPCCWMPLPGHESQVADEMRSEIRTMVAAGKSRDEILNHFVARYGERVLAVPRPEGFNRLMFILPWVALLFGAWLLYVLLRKLRAPASAAPSAPTEIPESAPGDRYASVIEKELKELDEK